MINNASAANYNPPSESRSDVLKPETPGTAEDQYAFTSSTTSYSYENSQHLEPAYSHAQTSSSYSYENTQQLDAAYSHPQSSLHAHLSPLASVMVGLFFRIYTLFQKF